MIPEEIYKQNLIQLLKSTDVNWVDGDKGSDRKKTADAVNCASKIAIEIKDDTKYKIKAMGGSYDLIKMNQRFGDHIRSANNKFKEYPGYKTVLLFRTEFAIVDIIRYVIEGLHSYSKHYAYIGRKGKYSKYNKQEIGCFLVINPEGYYFPNILVSPDRSMNKKGVEEIFGRNFNTV